jgi:hypothetical protein
VLGCGDKVIVDRFPAPDPSPYHIPSAPESTVLNYRIAWERRDSTMIDSVLTDDYVGTSVDQTDPSPATLTFTRSDETRALGGIQLDPLITSVRIDFNDSSSWSRTSDPSDPSDWVTISVFHPSILVTRSDANDLKSTNSQLEFKLKPTGSAPNTAWKIIRWSEVHSSI